MDVILLCFSYIPSCLYSQTGLSRKTAPTQPHTQVYIISRYTNSYYMFQFASIFIEEDTLNTPTIKQHFPDMPKIVFNAVGVEKLLKK